MVNEETDEAEIVYDLYEQEEIVGESDSEVDQN